MTQLATYQEKVKTVKQLLHQNSKSIVAALPKQIGADRFNRIVMTSVQMTPSLLECQPMSLLSAVLTCAQLGLEPDGVRNMAHLVPFGKKVTFIPGYMGLMDLCMRSGMFKNIEAHIVYAQDHFDYAYGSAPFISHKPAYERADRGEQIAAYCIAFFKQGGFQFRVMSMPEIIKVRDRSPAGRSGPWVTDFDAMALKTVIRHTVKYLPSSVVDNSLSLAVSLDERADAGIDQQLETLTGVDLQTGEIVEEKGKTALDKLTEQYRPEPPKATPPPPPPPPEESTTVTAEERKFIAEFKGLHKSGFETYLKDEQNIIRLGRLEPDSPVLKELDEKHMRFWNTPWPRPSFASPLPTGPSTEKPPEPREPVAQPLFGQGERPEAPISRDNLATADRTMEIDHFVSTQLNIDLEKWHDWVTGTGRMSKGRYTLYFSHNWAENYHGEVEAFNNWLE